MTLKTIIRASLIPTLLASLTLGGCVSPTEIETPVQFGHVHGIVDLGDGEMLLGTHTGIFSITRAGEVSGPIGGNDFDAMGITGNKLVQYSSGHPGQNTPKNLGFPNLGIIRSVDSGQSWIPVAFNGVEDFHLLTIGLHNEIYGIGSSSPALRKSLDGGTTWTEGPVIEAASLVITSEGLLFAATPSGLQLSDDQGSTFRHVSDAPMLYHIASGQNGALVGADVNGKLWRHERSQWQQFGIASGQVVALVETLNGEVVLVDDRGVVVVNGDQVDVIHKMSMSH